MAQHGAPRGVRWRLCGGNELAGEGLTPTYDVLDPTYVNSTQKIAKCVIGVGRRGERGQTTDDPSARSLRHRHRSIQRRENIEYR